MEDFNSKYTGQQVEDLLDQVANGEIGGGITVESDPIFSASPAATITNEDKASWIGKQDAISDLDAIRSGAEKGATALQSVPSEYVKQGQLDEISSAVGGLNENIGLLYQNKQNNITDLETIREGAAKGATAVQPSDIPEEIYLADFTMTSLRQGMNNGRQVDCDMNSLIEAMTANKTILVREEEDGYKGVYVLNGYAEDLLYFSIVDTAGDVLYCEGTDWTTNNYIDGQTLHVRRWDDKQDILVSGENIKTINGESILGEGNIIIAGGSGEKGDKGDKGDTGVGVQSVTQTTTSNADGGSNIVTVTLTDGTKSTFTVKNGSKGSQGIQGIQGEQGPKGDKGDKGDTGAAGTNGTNGKDGADGEDGATFTPSVDSAGNLSWSNNKGLANPPTVNIKGPKGDAVEGAATEEYVNNAIANAITNVINASY